jgi:hypothetical protein
VSAVALLSVDFADGSKIPEAVIFDGPVIQWLRLSTSSAVECASTDGNEGARFVSPISNALLSPVVLSGRATG